MDEVKNYENVEEKNTMHGKEEVKVKHIKHGLIIRRKVVSCGKNIRKARRL